MAIREGKWRCPKCTSVVRGSLMDCQGCGHTRDENTQFFLEDDAPVVTDTHQIAEAKAGPDWICTSCTNANRATKAACQSCGAPKDGHKTYKSEHPAAVKPKTEHHFSSSFSLGPAPPPPPQEQVRPKQHNTCYHDHESRTVDWAVERPNPIAKAAGYTVLVVMATVMTLCAWALFSTHNGVATISARKWERKINIETLTPVQETAWDGAPNAARDITHRSEVHHHQTVQRGTHVEYHPERYQSGVESYTVDEEYQSGTKSVKVGTRSLKNGYFEDVYKEKPVYSTRKVTKTRAVYSTRQVPVEVPTYVEEPVYYERYYYTIDRWIHTDTKTANGEANDPSWPTLVLDKLQREGTRSEFYEVTFQLPDSSTKNLKVDLVDDFNKYKLGTTWRIQWSVAGSVHVISEMTAEK